MSAGRFSFVLRAWEWIWQARAIAAAHVQSDEQRYQQVCAERAQVAAEVGSFILEPSAPWRAGSAHHLAAASFIESIGWSLRLAAPSHPSSNADTPLPSPPDRIELEALTSTHESVLLEAATGDHALVTRVVERALGRRNDAQSTVPAESELAARELGQVAHGLLRRPRVAPALLDELYFRRFARTSACVLGLLAVAGGVFAVHDYSKQRADLAYGRPWRASSVYEVVCVSPERRCNAGKPYFFHTHQEAEPWLELDLEKEQTFSGLLVVNRSDCCAERAVPLVLEVSRDQAGWREVSRRNEPFDVWNPRFPPVSARFVRLRVARASLLHLEQVLVLP